MGKHAKSIDNRVISRIYGHGRGHIFTPRDFLDFGARDAINHALSRAVRAGILRRLSHGMYDYPRRHPQLGTLPPVAENAARALQSRYGVRLQPSGGHAANMLGLSEQVPVKTVYYTDGRSRRVPLGDQVVVLKKTTPRQMATAGRISGVVIQALRWLGRRNVNDRTLKTLQRRLSAEDKRRLLADAHCAPAWIGDIMRLVAQSPSR